MKGTSGTLPDSSIDPGSTTTNPTAPSGQAAPAATVADDAGDVTTDTGEPDDEGKGPVSFGRFNQVRQRMKEAEAAVAKYKQAEKDAAARAAAAEVKRLQDAQEWEKLAATYKGDLEAAQATAAMATQYETALKAMLETERKGLPKPTLELLDKLNPADQLEWIAKHKAEMTRPPAPDTNAANRGGSKPKQPDDSERVAKKYGIRANKSKS